MKVLLVNTNLMKPPVAPIGLDYLADSIRAAGHEPQLLDLCFSDDIEKDITTVADFFEPDVIGVSVRNTDDCYFASGAFFLPGICEVVASAARTSESPEREKRHSSNCSRRSARKAGSTKSQG
ncbi:MAG: cobalamin B12-binding domain-containing protein [Spirochaetes bacterium]|nr:cobalamin B12-binding domain-containing protein [Spirochaetota bacterium]